MSPVLNADNTAETLWSIYGKSNRKDMVTHFRSHLCRVEIIRHKTIELVIFPRPKLFVASYAQLTRKHDTSVLDRCPHDDAVIKLQMWQEISLELCHEVMAAEWANEGTKLNVFFANFGRKATQLFTAVTIAIRHWKPLRPSKWPKICLYCRTPAQ